LDSAAATSLLIIDIAANRAAPIDAALRAEIADMEEDLRDAMLSGDAVALERLISDRLLSTSPAGAMVSKEEELEIHRSGALRLKRLELSERRMMEVAGVVVVTTRADLTGTWNGASWGGTFRYTRVWSRDRIGRWQVVMSQATAAA